MPHSDPQWLTAARAEGRILSERTVAPTLPGVEAAEPGAVFVATLPWPPSVNHYWVHFVQKKVARIALGEAGKAYRAAMIQAVGKVKPLTGPLMFDATFHPPTLAKIDLDNRLKPTLDALTVAGVWFDDSQIREIRARFGPVDRTGGRIEVRVMPLAEVDHSKEIA